MERRGPPAAPPRPCFSNTIPLGTRAARQAEAADSRARAVARRTRRALEPSGRPPATRVPFPAMRACLEIARARRFALPNPMLMLLD